MARRHVEEGRLRILRQLGVIARLRALNLPTQRAEELLTTFQSVQDERAHHLRTYLDEQAKGLRDADGNRVWPVHKGPRSSPTVTLDGEHHASEARDY